MTRLDNRPTGWKPNPQALAAVSSRRAFSGSAELGTAVDTDTWLTPSWILDHLGSFDLDPCAAGAFPSRVAPRYFTKDLNGLTQQWVGRVFMNPPFSDTRPWIEKHSDYGLGISLVAASFESKIWRKCVWPRAKAIFLLHGRTRFCNPDGSTTTGRPLRSIALIAWGDVDAEMLGRVPFAGIHLTAWRQQ